MFAVPFGRRRAHAARLLAALSLLYLLGGLAAPGLAEALGPETTGGRLLIAWRATLRDGVVLLIAAAVTVPALAALRPSRLQAHVPPATPGTLGAIRAWVALILLASALWEDLASTAYLPREMLRRDPQWLVELLLPLPGVESFLASHTALLIAERVIEATLLLATLGLFTRWTVPLGALGYFLLAILLRSYAWSYHTGVIPLYALALLAFAPCGDGWSLDRLLRRRRGLPLADDAPALRYGVGRYLVWMAIAIPYTLAGLSKLRNTGPLWWTGEHMKQMVVATAVEPMHFDFTLGLGLLQAPAWVWAALGVSALLGELLFALVLVSRPARLLFPLLMAGMHVGILLTQNILFPDLIAIQAVFYERRSAARASSAAVPQRLARMPAAFLVLAVLAWATRTERFPLTAMQMFSRPVPPAPVEYVRAWAEYEDGTREPARFERWIGAMADSRYRWLIRRWGDDPARLEHLHRFLEAVAARARAEPGGPRLQRFVLEQRRWDFRAHPADPQRGELRRVVVHEVR